MTSRQELTDERNERFMSLLRPVYPDCQRWSYTLAGNQVDAEDVLEEGILTALQKIHQLKNDSAFKAWMFRILTNVHRAQLRSKKPVDSMELVQAAKSPLTVGEGIEAGERAQAVHAALARLAPEQRQALELFELHELSMRQVAQVMGKPEGHLRVTLHRARKRLAQYLSEAGIEPVDLGNDYD